MAVDNEGTQAWKMADGASMKFSSSHDLAISLWVNRQSSFGNTQRGLVAWYHQSAYSFSGRRQRFRFQVTRTGGQGGNPNVVEMINCDANVNVNEWHHLFGEVYLDGPVWVMRFYLDNVEQGAAHPWGGDEYVVYPSASDQWIVAGGSIDPTGFLGADETVIVDQAWEAYAVWHGIGGRLSAEERTFLYESRLIDAPLLIGETGNRVLGGFWRFDEYCAGESVDGRDVQAIAGPAVFGVSPTGWGASGGKGLGSILSRCGGIDVVDFYPWPRFVSAGQAILDLSTPTPTVSPGGVSLTASQALLSILANSATVSPGEVSVQPLPFLVEATSGPHVVTPGNVTVVAEPFLLEASVPTVSVSPGEAAILVSKAAVACAANAITVVVPHATISVQPFTLELRAVLADVRLGLIVLPDGRGILIEAEDREVIVASEDRTVKTESEDRTIVVPSEDRTIVVPDEDRTIVVPEAN